MNPNKKLTFPASNVVGGVISLVAATIMGTFAFCGISCDAPQAKSAKQTWQSELPAGAKNITDKGNGWITFEVEDEGVTRKFIFRQVRNSYDSTFGTETITEIGNPR